MHSQFYILIKEKFLKKQKIKLHKLSFNNKNNDYNNIFLLEENYKEERDENYKGGENNFYGEKDKNYKGQENYFVDKV